MFEKKRWFDGLHDLYEGKDEFEIKLGLFGGDGGEGGGGTPTKGTNAINRGTVGLTAAEMNARADAQERGSREVANLSAGVTPSANFGYTDTDTTYNQQEQGDFSGTDNPVAERFVTSTEGAYRDLDRRADVGQIDPSIGVIETPFGSLRTPTSAALGAVNKFGMSRAQDIRDQIRGGGVPVTDRFGRIQGVVSEGTGPVADILGAFGQNRNVYTGGPGFAPSTSQLMSYRPDPTRQGIASLPYADVQMPTTTRAQPLSQPVTTERSDRDLRMDALMRGVNNPQSNPQLGTVNDPTAQAGVLEGIGDFFTETVPGFFDYSTPSKSAPLSGYFKGGTGARTYYQGPGKDVKRPFKGSETGFGEFFEKINPFN
jgi:hypothetical protein